MIKLRFLSDKLSIEQMNRLDRKLSELRGEVINLEYWEEVFYYPYKLDEEEAERILYVYSIKVKDQLKK